MEKETRRIYLRVTKCLNVYLDTFFTNAYNDSIMDKKAIQIRNDDSPKGISLTIGNTKVNTLGKPVSIKFEN